VNGLTCVTKLRGIANGFELGLTLLSLGAVGFIQSALGAFRHGGTARRKCVELPLPNQ
jgi:hypothetical protein